MNQHKGEARSQMVFRIMLDPSLSIRVPETRKRQQSPLTLECAVAEQGREAHSACRPIHEAQVVKSGLHLHLESRAIKKWSLKSHFGQTLRCTAF